MTTLLKTNRIFTRLRKYSYLFTLIVSLLGLVFPKLGLLVYLVIFGLIITGYKNGRYWCGNVCAHGSFFDRLLLPISKNKPIPNFFKSKIISFFVFIGFLFMISRRLILALSKGNRYDLLDRFGIIFVYSYLVVLILGGLLAVFISPRTWCNICPMGQMQKMAHNFGKNISNNQIERNVIAISSSTNCIGCQKCSSVCPMQLKPHEVFSQRNIFEKDACIKCKTCIYNCPVSIIELKKVI